MNQYENLIARLDAFVRKYYANQLLRGLLVLLIGLLAYVMLASVSEYFLYLPVWIKVTLVSLFVLLGTGAFVFWVTIPLAKMARLGKCISHEQAAAIIGTHFPEVSDQLLNILQLKQQEHSAASKQLIEASIGQKINNISVVPIGKAIDFRRNKKYLPILLPLLLLAIFILVAAPNVFREASERLLQPTKEFVKPAPFQFNINSLPLQVVRSADYTLKINMSGKVLPSNVFLAIGNEQIPMIARAQHSFEYSFKNCTEDIEFRFYASGFYSEKYRIKVLQRPQLAGIQVALNYPAYTGRKNEIKNGVSDMIVPEGSSVVWALTTQHADNVWFQLGDAQPIALKREDATSKFQYRFLNDTNYTIILQNEESNVIERFNYRVQVISDQFPVLQVQEFKDTVSGTQVVLNGTAGDDYGIVRVLFHCQILAPNNKLLSSKSFPVKTLSGTVSTFQHYFDVASLGMNPGEQLNYYIEAWDNDAVHGSKSSRSEMMTYKAFNAQQIDSAISKSAQQINSGLSNSAKQNEQLQDEIQSLQNKMLQSEQMDWQQKQALQDLAKLQEKMKNNLEQTKKRFEEQIKQTEQKNLSESLKEKQEALKNQMDNLLNKELKEQMKKIQELLQKLNKEQSVQQLQQLQEENKLFSMDMERMQELMKKLELQMRMESMADKMDQLAKQQTELRQQTDKAQTDAKTLAKEQEKLKSALKDALKKDMQDLKNANQDVKQKQDLAKEEQQGEKASEEMQKSEDQLDQNQNSNSSKSQSKAAQNLQDMANSLRQKSGSMEMEEIEMDIRAVRQILTNLMRLSFDQEELIKTVKTTPANNPTFLTNMEQQNALHDNSLVIRDSLFSLSKKLFKLSANINKETNQLEKNMRSAIGYLEQRHIPEAATRQQYVMTHTNNLALMLNEILANLMSEQSQAQKNPGNGQCNKPGGKNPKPGAGKQLSDIIGKQKGLGQSMMKSMDGKPKDGDEGKQGKDGKQPKQGGKGGNGGEQNGGEDGNAKELMQMAQQQAAIRRQLAQLNQMLNSQGNNSIAKELKELQEKMDRNETDLVNKKLDGDFYMRQKEILTRMMETEKSLREQEQDDKRSSKNPEEISRPVPPELQQYLQENKELKEQYKTVPPNLKPYYKQLNENYFKQVGA
ncbi:MAG: hypothetical protein QM530_04995 [Phycisphaerales bacterium]|nr:hypothetical protein [Phycisphaerales bacterium]